MTRACILATLIALTAGCRERNPEWLGPASETSASSDTTTSDTTAPASTSSDPTTDPSTGGEATTAQSETSTGGPIPCNNNAQCPDGLLCGPDGCQVGQEGDPCDRDRDCGDMAPICSSAKICQDGSPGDPCASPDDCVDVCEGEVCVAEAGGSSTGGRGSSGG